jgi:protein FAM50
VENLFRDETKKNKKRKKAARATLSFALDDEDAEGDSPKNMKGESANEDSNAEEPPVKRSKLKKNPSVDTSFLPDREREEAERRERERLRLEWLTMQEQAKKEDIEITYSYWDGSGHRKTVTVSAFYILNSFIFLSIFAKCKKGDTVTAFLEKCRAQFP